MIRYDTKIFDYDTVFSNTVQHPNIRIAYNGDAYNPPPINTMFVRMTTRTL